MEIIRNRNKTNGKFTLRRSLTALALIAATLCISTPVFAEDAPQKDVPVQLWRFDSLTQLGQLGGKSVKVFGDVALAESTQGVVTAFDGQGDQILVDTNPIGDSKEFTLEVIFLPDGGAVNQRNEPRFIHIQDPMDPAKKRVMLELRVNPEGRVYLDAFMNTDNANLTLIDPSKNHPTGVWMHAAITYKDGILSTYVNGVLELQGQVGFSKAILNTKGQTAVGGRMDKRNYYQGQIKTIRITQRKLEPSEFLATSEIVAP